MLLGLYGNLADVLDAPLKVGSNVGWAVLARFPHKSHISNIITTDFGSLFFIFSPDFFLLSNLCFWAYITI